MFVQTMQYQLWWYLEMNNKYDAIIIGSGLGGLLAGAILSNKGYKPLILEKLSFIGGKFTSFNHNDCEVPTGAFHALPGGNNGNIGKIIKNLDLNVEMIESSPPFVVFQNNNYHLLPLTHKHFRYIFNKNCYLKLLTFKEILQLLRILYITMYSKSDIPDVTFKEFIKKYTSNINIFNLFNKIITFTNSTDIDNASAVDVVNSLRIQNRTIGCVIQGGCKSLVLEIAGFIEKKGGIIRKNIYVDEILIDDKNRAIGVVADKKEFLCNLIISNTGPKQTINLLKNNCPEWLLKKAEESIPVFGIAYSISLDKQFIKHKSVVLPTDAKKICGLIPISNYDPNLSKKDENFILAYQSVDHLENIEEAIMAGKQELFNIFPYLADENIFNISVYKDDWPATFTQQRLGQTNTQRYPIRFKGIENFYMIGHDSEGCGFAAEIIGDAALKLNEII